jgi:signal peptidase II
MRWALVALTLAIVAVLAVWLARTAQAGLAAALGAVIGGALGNVMDRLIHGAVADFLDFHAFGWHWPAFNLADAAIVCGIGWLILGAFFAERK